jgi:hypothetical protein
MKSHLSFFKMARDGILWHEKKIYQQSKKWLLAPLSLNHQYLMLQGQRKLERGHFGVGWEWIISSRLI